MTTLSDNNDLIINNGVDENDDTILEAWLEIHGKSDLSDADTLALAKKNFLGSFHCPDDYVMHEIERMGWWTGVNNILASNIDLEGMAHSLEYRSDDYHGSDNHNGHYFIVQD